MCIGAGRTRKIWRNGEEEGGLRGDEGEGDGTAARAIRGHRGARS